MLTREYLRSVIDYSPDTGEFRWSSARRGVRIGELCGRINNHGYREIGVAGKLHQAHRLAFLYMTGEMPKNVVDHINGDRADNRWINLRPANQSQNMANVGGRSTNTSGAPGVVWDADRQKWRAQLRVNGKKKNLGRFASFEDARNAVNAAARQQWGEFARWAER